tara:strand:- start:414 stop:2228 length:1815 start_codon:yes stop_codon:yes gene_type:complete
MANKSKYLLEDDETYVDQVIESIFKTQDSVNIFRGFKAYVNTAKDKITSRVFNYNAKVNATYFYNIVNFKTNYSVVYDDIKSQGSIGTFKMSMVLLECKPDKIELIHTQTGLPKKMLKDSTHLKVEERVVVFRWEPTLSLLYHVLNFGMKVVKLGGTVVSTVATGGATAPDIIPAINDIATSGPKFASVIYDHTVTVKNIAANFGNFFTAKAQYEEASQAGADLHPGNNPQTGSASGNSFPKNLKDLSDNLETPRQKVNRAFYNPARWILGSERDESVTEYEHRARDAIGDQKEMENKLQFIIVQQITPVKIESEFKHDFAAKKEYSTNTINTFSLAAVRVGQITSIKYSELNIFLKNLAMLQEDENLKTFLKPWGPWDSANFIRDFKSASRDKVNDFKTFSKGKWLPGESSVTNKPIGEEVMAAHNADLKRSGLLKIKFQHLVREYNKEQAIKSVAGDVKAAQLAKQRRKFLSYIHNDSMLKYDNFLKATESWTFGVVKNARTNKDLSFIDLKLFEFEAKIKEGNIYTSSPVSYFSWNSEIHFILSGIIDGCDSYLKSKNVREGVDPVALTGRKRAVIDLSKQALIFQDLALDHLTFLDKKFI